MNRGRIKLTTLTYAMEAATENTVTKNALSGHIFKRFIKEKYDYLNPVSVKVKKNNTVVARIGGTQAYWEFVMETHKVFLTIQDKKDKDMEILPWIDPEDFNPGYLMRSMHLLPKRGDKPEWQHTQDYWNEKNVFPAIDLEDKAFVYG